MTLVLSSHILSDVQELCDRVSIMAQGELKAVFPISELPQLVGEKFLLVVRNLPSHLAVRGSQEAVHTEQDESNVCYTFSSRESASALLTQAISAGAEVREFRAVTPSLEEVFMKMTEGA